MGGKKVHKRIQEEKRRRRGNEGVERRGGGGEVVETKGRRRVASLRRVRGQRGIRGGRNAVGSIQAPGRSHSTRHSAEPLRDLCILSTLYSLLCYALTVAKLPPTQLPTRSSNYTAYTVCT